MKLTVTARCATVFAVPLLLASVAAAESLPSDFLNGVYSSEEACASGINHLRDDGVTYLDESGLSAIEYNCEFLHYFGVPDSRAFIAITACSAPGELIPETILVRDQINGPDATDPSEEVTVLYQGSMEEQTFWRCKAE